MNAIEPDPVQRMFARIQQSAASTTVVPDLDEVIARASRRGRTRAVVAATITAVATVVALATAVFLDQPGGDRSLPASPTPPPGGERVDPSSYIYSGFLETSLLPVKPEGAPSEFRYRDIPLCSRQAFDALAIARSRSDGAHFVISLYLFADEEAARAVMAELGPELLGCHYLVHAGLVPSQWPAFGDESAGVTYRVAPDGAGELAARGAVAHHVAVRVGRAIEVFDASPTLLPNDAAGRLDLLEWTSTDVIAVVADSIPRLCLYSSACASAPSGLPTPLTSLTPQGQAWLLELFPYVPRYFVQSEAAGRVIAHAGELGYRPMIVTPGCDHRLDSSLEHGDERARYLALYFADRAQAEAAAAEFRKESEGTGMTLRIYEVRTLCVG